MEDHKIYKKKYIISQFIWFIMWLFTGLIIAYMTMWMSATKSKSLTNTLNFGKVCDVRYSVNYSSSFGKDNKNRIDYFEDRNMIFDFTNDKGKWKYLYINIADMDVESIKCELSLGNNYLSELKYTKEATLVKGMNKIKLTGEPFNCAYVKVVEPENCQIIVNNVQVREKEKVSLKKGDIFMAASSFFAYILITLCIGVVFKRRKLDWYACVKILQDIYIVIGNSFLWVPQKISPQLRSVLRRGLIVVWMSFMMIRWNIGKGSGHAYYKYNLLFCVMIVFIISLLMLEKRMHRVLWKRQIVFCWLAVSSIMCVSEFFKMKRFSVTGYVFLTLFGFLYLVWNNMDERNIFISDIICSLRILLYISVIFSVLFRPYIVGYGYAGPTWNPNVFAMFLVPALVADLAKIIETVKKKTWRRMGIYIFESCISIVFILLAGSRIGELTMCIVLLLFLFYMNRYVLSKREILKEVILIIPTGVLLVVMYFVLLSSISHIPSLVGHEIEFPADDIKQSEIQATIINAYASDGEPWMDNIIYDSRVSTILTERNLYWMGYLRNMNFLGHRFYPKFWGAHRNAHNGILTVSYMYGVLIAVPYIFLYLEGIWISFRKLLCKRENAQYTFFLFGIYVITFCFMMVENTERPFLATEWILFYLMLGYLFPIKNKECVK